MALFSRSSSVFRFTMYTYLALSLFIMIWLILNFGSSCLIEGDTRLENLKRSLAEKEDFLMKLQKQLEASFPQVTNILGNNSRDIPRIYAITPTYTRYVQKAELVRLSQTFLNVPNFHWIVVEDSSHKTDLVANFLRNCGLRYTHLNIATTKEFKLKSSDPNWLKPRGVDQRNEAIEWLRNNTRLPTSAVAYFADDDNTYSLKLFKEMRFTKKVSVWPVALSGGLRYEHPIIRNGKVIGWFTLWEPQRPFAMDMAGFAVNADLFHVHPEGKFDIKSKRGFVESSLLLSLGIKLQDLEPMADNCTKVYVWHTRTEKPNMKQEDRLKAKGIVYKVEMEV